MHATVVVFPGSNADAEMIHTLRDVVGMTTVVAWHKEAELPEPTDLIAIPGGFSYGDVLGAGEGWAKSILFHAGVRAQFMDFFAPRRRQSAEQAVPTYRALTEPPTDSGSGAPVSPSSPISAKIARSKRSASSRSIAVGATDRRANSRAVSRSSRSSSVSGQDSDRLLPATGPIQGVGMMRPMGRIAT